MEARAKVNLFLRVLGRRPDGYHELETLVVPVSLADRVEVRARVDRASRAVSVHLEVVGDPEVLSGVPLAGTNLVIRAARALAEAAGVGGTVRVRLTKRVPAGAGLGGGSADAAATIRALHDLWELGLEEVDLLGVAAAVGSDVPALLAGGAVLARGRGERVERVPVAPMELALVTFPLQVRTAEAFGWWDEDGGPTGPDPADLLRSLHPGAVAASGLGSLGGLFFNDLEPSVVARRPEVGEAKAALLEGGAVAAVMCGSGPSVAGVLPPGGRLGARARARLRRLGARVLRVRTVPGEGRPMRAGRSSGGRGGLGPRDSNADLRDQNPASCH